MEGLRAGRNLGLTPRCLPIYLLCMVPMQAIRILTARLLAAQSPEEAFSLVVALRSPATASKTADSTRSESQRAVEHAYTSVGRRESTATVISMLLAQRFGPLTEVAKAQIGEMNVFQLQDVAERLLAVPHSTKRLR